MNFDEQVKASDRAIALAESIAQQVKVRGQESKQVRAARAFPIRGNSRPLMIETLIERDGSGCQFCGRVWDEGEMDVHHSLHEKASVDNSIMLHRGCHRTLHALAHAVGVLIIPGGDDKVARVHARGYLRKFRMPGEVFPGKGGWFASGVSARREVASLRAKGALRAREEKLRKKTSVADPNRCCQSN